MDHELVTSKLSLVSVDWVHCFGIVWGIQCIVIYLFVLDCQFGLRVSGEAFLHIGATWEVYRALRLNLSVLNLLDRLQVWIKFHIFWMWDLQQVSVLVVHHLIQTIESNRRTLRHLLLLFHLLRLLIDYFNILGDLRCAVHEFVGDGLIIIWYIIAFFPLVFGHSLIVEVWVLYQTCFFHLRGKFVWVRCVNAAYISNLWASNIG